MATFDLGRVTPLYKGDYSASASYELNDMVLYNGNLYWHVQAAATVGILPTDTTIWKLAFTDEGVRAEIRGYADNAQNSADSALASKSAAAQSASQASASESHAALSAQTAQTAQGLAETAQTAAETAQGLAEDARDLAQQYAESIDPENIYSAYPTDTASGSIASFFDGADNIPLKSLMVDINPVQSGSGDPSPDNVRPISGWTGCEVTRTGKNLFDSATVFASLGFTHEDDGSWSRENIAGIGNAQVWKNPGFVSQISIRFTAKYASDISTGIRFKIKYTNGTLEILYLTPSLTYQNYTFVSKPNKVVSAVLIDYGSSNIKTWFKDVQFEASSTATPYEPYAGRSITINLGQTVYGGKLDVLTGILTVYPYYASYNGETLTGEWISDRDVYAVGTTPTIGAQVVNIGAQGTEIQLDAHAVNSLLGTNNIYVDTGDTTVEYRANTSAYVAKKIAEAISALS